MENLLNPVIIDAPSPFDNLGAAGGAGDDLFSHQLITVLTKLHRLLAKIRVNLDSNAGASSKR